MHVGVADSCDVSLSKPYLRGILEELLSGQSMDFHTKIYNKDFLKEKILQVIKEMCFELAKKFWVQAKRVLEYGITRSPFIYYDENKRSFMLSQTPDSEELLLSLLESDEERIIIYSTFYQECFDNQNEFNDDYVHYCSASRMEEFLRKRINV